MPTVLLIDGWRFFFYMSERNEPPHIHVEKGDADAKYWLLADEFEVREAYGHNVGPADRRAIRRIIFEHFDYLLAKYEEIHGRE